MSTSSEPYFCWILLKILGFSIQSDQSLLTRNSWSAIVLRTPGKRSATRVISQFMHQSHSSLTMVFSLGDTVPPSLFTCATTVVLSILTRTVMLFLSLTKNFTAWKAAKVSRQLICYCLSSGDQGLPARAPSQDAP